VVGKEAVKELLSKHHDLSVLEALRQMDWEVVRVPSPSPLVQEFLDKLMVSSTSEDKPLILEVFKRRMLSKEILLRVLSAVGIKDSKWKIRLRGVLNAVRFSLRPLTLRTRKRYRLSERTSLGRS